MKNLSAVVSIGLLISLVMLFPLAQIWALNTLFAVLSIPYNFWTWLAVVIFNISWFYKPNIQKVKVVEQ